MIRNILVSLYLVLILFFTPIIGVSQNIDIESIGKGKAFKLGGSFSANSVLFSSSQDSGREPFTYFIQGGVNIGFFQFSAPISYSFSNQGANLSYQTPFDFNRLSLHPKYKWVQAHIGDVSMSFSPLTLSGHQFSGFGLDLTPSGGYTINLMVGRLLKRVEYDGEPNTTPVFKRMGYGLKFNKTFGKHSMGIICFYAKDDPLSLSQYSIDQGVAPKENLVISLEGKCQLLDNLSLSAEYASTALTHDTRIDSKTNIRDGLASLFINNLTSTEYYTSVKGAFSFSLLGGNLGVTYERIDPGYETLGTYYSNSDIENITFTGSSTLFKEKLSLSFNIGLQYDDLDNLKSSATNRLVASLTGNLKASERLGITFSYSNFTTYTNSKVDQFDLINDDNLLDNESDQLDYKQLSRSGNLGLNFKLSTDKRRPQNLNVNYSISDVSNEQGGVVRVGGVSSFHNLSSSYSRGVPNISLNLTGAINGTYNTIGRDESLTWGPTLSANKKFFDKKFNSSLTFSYNSSSSETTTSSVSTIRLNGSYIIKKKHNFNLNTTHMSKSTSTSLEGSWDLTTTLGYSYSF